MNDVLRHSDTVKPQRFLAFETDFGGWNNILMQLEIMVVLAWITGRTLVLPPAKPFYLLGEASRLLEDFLDLDALRRQIPVLTADEFVEVAELDTEVATDEKFHDLMRARGVMPPWNGVEDILLFPSDALLTRPELLARLAGPSQAHRQLITISNELRECDLLYFPMTTEHRMFGVAECFFLFGDEQLERRARTLLRDAIRFRQDIINLAEAAINAPILAGRRFSALHIRRGDFQYAKTRIGARQIHEHVQTLLSPEHPIYIATDETDGAFLDGFREKFEVVTFSALPRETVANTPHHWCGIVETLICAAAPGRFMGTRFSTFSTRISTIRGHLACTSGGDFEGVDTNLYYTQQPLNRKAEEGLLGRFWRKGTRHVDPVAETATPWWLSKDPLWARAYQVCWLETDN
jgi:hypothetical protein